MTTTETVSRQLDRFAEIVGGKAWGADKLRPRIYMPTGRKDAKVFFSFEDDASYTDSKDPADAVHGLAGHVLRVYIDDCGQSPKWYSSQKKQIMDRYRNHSLALSAAVWLESDQLAREIVAADIIDDDSAYNAAANHLINGRPDEARAAIAEFLPAE